MVELGMGLSWETEHVHLSIGYDMANWFNMTNSLDFPSATDVGKIERRTSDLTLEGLTVKVGVVF